MAQADSIADLALVGACLAEVPGVGGGDVSTSTPPTLMKAHENEPKARFGISGEMRGQRARVRDPQFVNRNVEQVLYLERA